MSDKKIARAGILLYLAYSFVLAGQNSTHETIPLPGELNEALDDIQFLLSQVKERKENPYSDKRALYFYCVDKVNAAITQETKEFKTEFSSEKLCAMQNIKADLRDAYLHHDINIATVFHLGVKLCFRMDIDRIKFYEDPLKWREALPLFTQTNIDHLSVLYKPDALRVHKEKFPNSQNLKFLIEIAFLKFREMSSYFVDDFPIIALINDSGYFGINTYLHAFAEGFIIVGFPINNNSQAHQGLVKSFASYNRIVTLYLYKSPETLLPNCSFPSSTVGFLHDFFHFLEIRNFKKNTDTTKAYCSAYAALINDWKKLNNPQTIALFIYWLFHESSYGYSHAHRTVQFFVKNTLGKYRESIVLDDISIESFGPNLDKIKLDKKIKKIIIVNEFDFAEALKKMGHNLNIDKENPISTLQAMGEIFLETFENAGQVKNAFDAINNDWLNECLEVTRAISL